MKLTLKAPPPALKEDADKDADSAEEVHEKEPLKVSGKQWRKLYGEARSKMGDIEPGGCSLITNTIMISSSASFAPCPTPLTAGFTLRLNLLSPPPAQPLYHHDDPRAANPPPESTPNIVRQPPPLPTEVDTVHTLLRPLQTGLEHEGEVWLAQPCQPHRPGGPPSEVVLKCVIPSRLPRPPTDLTEATLHRECLYTLPYEVVDCEAKAYEWLHDLQGSTLPYYHGVHPVTMPWDEVVSNLRSPRSGVSTREWHIHHLDISDANILVDEEHDYAVLIDFINIARLQIMEKPEDTYLWAFERDIEDLVREFLQCRRHHSEFVKYVQVNHRDVESVYPVIFEPEAEED
ncbi:hypothetical protein K466DRAFT_602822 [Polyporus arcularius HHB13444]|uniref:Uncharacterized protein n=1 Tax=Polyporus arcularius HHB13444 TaxID=1314778 RepID=A0A5C3PC98_9APHY|nr:hypothetical protein K466DRAFT_602822 [Polyporus arcularius HHB13444]